MPVERANREILTSDGGHTIYGRIGGGHASVGMMTVEMSVQIPQRSMIGAMLAMAVKALPVGSVVCYRDTAMKFAMASVVTRMPIPVLMRVRRRADERKWRGSGRMSTKRGFRSDERPRSTR